MLNGPNALRYFFLMIFITPNIHLDSEDAKLLITEEKTN